MKSAPRFSFLLVCVISLAMNRLASAEDPAQTTKGLIAEWKLEGQPLVTMYVLFPETVFEFTARPDGTPVGGGWGQLKRRPGDRIEITWFSGGREVGRFRDGMKDTLEYTIESHTDKRQVGLKMAFHMLELPAELGVQIRTAEANVRAAMVRTRLNQTRVEEEIKRMQAEIERMQIDGALERIRIWTR